MMFGSVVHNLYEVWIETSKGGTEKIAVFADYEEANEFMECLSVPASVDRRELR